MILGVNTSINPGVEGKATLTLERRCSEDRTGSRAIAPASRRSLSEREVPTWKRVLDVSCIIIALPLIAPVMGLVALLIKCVSKGPVLFRQERVGYRGRLFTCLKFRTMIVGSSTKVHEEHCRQLIATGAPMTKLDDQEDDRIIPFGPVLRSTGLDELPQLLNVLRGEMSLVGPRPCLPAEYESYSPEQKRRFDAVPGLTGLWQVSGKNSTTFARMIELDLDYARNQRLFLDFGILMRTLPVVVAAGAKAVRRRLSRSRLLRNLIHGPLEGNRSYLG